MMIDSNVFMQIVKHLDARGMLNFSETCKRFNRFLKSNWNMCWKIQIWKEFQVEYISNDDPSYAYEDLKSADVLAVDKIMLDPWREYEVEQIVYELIEDNNSYAIQYLFDRHTFYNPLKYMIECIKIKHYDIFMYLYKNFKCSSDQLDYLFNQTVYFWNIDIFEFFLNENVNLGIITGYHLEIVTRNNNFEIVDYLLNYGIAPSYNCFRIAIKYQNVEILRMFANYNPQAIEMSHMTGACRLKNLEIIKILETHLDMDENLIKNCIINSITHNRDSITIYLMSKYEISTESLNVCFKLACGKGFFHIIKYILTYWEFSFDTIISCLGSINIENPETLNMLNRYLDKNYKESEYI